MSVFSEQALVHLQTHQPFPVRQNEKSRGGFFPSKDPSKLHNCKQYYWIQPDGSSVVAAYFSPLEKSFREDLILEHYVSHLCKRLRIRIGLNILKRDSPWDFRIGFSSGVTANVEIVSITDRPNFFRILTAEELIQRHSYYPTVRLGILKKIAKAFPDEAVEELLAVETAKGMTNSDEVHNPYFPQKPNIFTSLRSEPPLELTAVIRDALVSKEKKRHEDKSETILLIDNRTTTASLNDLMVALEDLKPLVDFVRFPEIWLYTGYGGVHPSRGNRMIKKYTEYSLLPIKLNPETYSDYKRSRPVM